MIVDELITAPLDAGSVYEARISNLIAQHLTGDTRKDIGPLLADLGCLHVAMGSGLDPALVLVRPAKPNRDYESLIRTTLVHLMQRSNNLGYSDTLAVLGGLLEHGRWKACLESADCAFEFGFSLVSYFRTVEFIQANEDLGEAIALDMFDAVNEWLRPQPSFVPYDTSRDLCREIEALLFGEMWCDIALVGIKVSPEEALGIIRSQRPPIKMHLLPSHTWETSAPLPQLSISEAL
jgi:hypothetical protein